MKDGQEFRDIERAARPLKDGQAVVIELLSGGRVRICGSPRFQKDCHEIADFILGARVRNPRRASTVVLKKGNFRCQRKKTSVICQNCRGLNPNVKSEDLASMVKVAHQPHRKSPTATKAVQAVSVN